MKLVVQGIEEIEITDPAGLCNPPVPQLPQGMPQLPQPMRGNPIPSGMYPPGQPLYPLPGGAPAPIPGFGDPTTRPRPGIRPEIGPAIYTRHVDDPNGQPKWAVGGDAIQRAGQQVDPEKWEKNWQASVGQPTELTERSRRILRGEDPEDGNRTTR